MDFLERSLVSLRLISSLDRNRVKLGGRLPPWSRMASWTTLSVFFFSDLARYYTSQHSCLIERHTSHCRVRVSWTVTHTLHAHTEVSARNVFPSTVCASIHVITKALAFKSTLRFRCMFSSSMFQFLFFFFLKTERIGLWSFYKLVFSVSRNFFFFRKRIRVLLTRVKRNSSRLRRSLKLRFSRKRKENRNFRVGKNFWN